jgi:outer membrane lipoprotein carrier protein
MTTRRTCLRVALMPLLAVVAARGRADTADALRAFIRDVRSGRAEFTQTVTSTDGGRRRVSNGEFEFQRPNRFRFDYTKPYPQLIVADGSKVWIYDPDLNQASSRPVAQALGATPAALLAGGSLDADFVLSSQPAANGLEWVLATPKAKDGAFQSIRVGFSGGSLAQVEIVDSFGQRSDLAFSRFEPNAAIPPERFRFAPPGGTDIIEQ